MTQCTIFVVLVLASHFEIVFLSNLLFCSGVASLQTFRLAARTSGGQVLFNTGATTAGQANLWQV